jgi:hypothetical protein
MPCYHHHFSAAHTEPVPPVSELPFVEADDPAKAVEAMLAKGCFPQDPAIRWARVVVGIHDNGVPRLGHAISGHARTDWRGDRLGSLGRRFVLLGSPLPAGYNQGQRPRRRRSGPGRRRRGPGRRNEACSVEDLNPYQSPQTICVPAVRTVTEEVTLGHMVAAVVIESLVAIPMFGIAYSARRDALITAFLASVPFLIAIACALIHLGIGLWILAKKLAPSGGKA